MRRKSVLTVVLTALAVAAAAFANPARAAGAAPVLVDIRAGQHHGFDRIVFEFDGPVPRHVGARWAEVIRSDDSGRPLNLHGEAFIEVTMSDVVAHEGEWNWGSLTYTSPDRSLALANLNHMVSRGDYEGHMTVGLGLMQRTRILRAFTLAAPSRYVVDISNDFPRRWAPVYFLPNPGTDAVDRLSPPNDTAPDGSALHRVLRTVPVPAVARGQLHRFYAGPTQTELRAGILGGTSTVSPESFEDENMRGFGSLRVADGVAHVRLKGPCVRFSWEDVLPEVTQLTPTLTYWPTVEHVKIYDHRGRTRNPSGSSDSAPQCPTAP